MFALDKVIQRVGSVNCFISEVTVAELKFGIENSKTPELIRPLVEALIPQFTITPIFDSLDIYAKEKSRLRKTGFLIDDFDLIIGATAIHHGMILVTNNTKHLNRLSGIQIEDWTQ
jgi:tRNA(fMet)-specific endonuclease VapC